MQHQFLLDDRARTADPASCGEPRASHGTSALWDPDRYAWNDSEWRGVPLEELVLYEVHVGAFTSEGTFDAVIPRLPALRDLGITGLELTSVAEFVGQTGENQDFHADAIRQSWGGPDGLQRLVDACHTHGMAVIADLAHEALGFEAEGPLAACADPPGAASPSPAPPQENTSQTRRQFALDGIRSQIRHFHLDGLRLNLVDSDLNPAERETLVEVKKIAAEIRVQTGRCVHVMAHSPLHDVGFLDPQHEGGCGLDAIWNEDFHHSLHVMLTGDLEESYADFSDPRRQMMKALNQTFVFDGFCSRLRGKPYSAPAGGHDGRHFVVSLQDSAHFKRHHAEDRLSTRVGPASLRLAAGMMLMAPHVPLIFMGDEYGEDRPFRQRSEEVDAPGTLPSPFPSIAWRWNEGSWQAGLRRLYADLLMLRRTLPPLRDFQNRTARIIPTPDGLSFLHLARGDGEASFGTLHVWFNWNDSELTLPGRLSDRSPPLLTSDSPQYGGGRSPGAPVTSLAPYEFAIFGT